VAGRLEKVLPAWRQYPRETKDWLIFEFDPDLMNIGEIPRTSVVNTLRKVKTKYARVH